MSGGDVSFLTSKQVAMLDAMIDFDAPEETQIRQCKAMLVLEELLLKQNAKLVKKELGLKKLHYEGFNSPNATRSS